jgi:hypothetical protein
MKTRLTTLVLAMTLGVLWAATAVAQQTGVTYHLYHFESGSWVEYGAGDAFPAGGDQPGTNLWRYTYELCNVGFSTGLRELDVFFNSDNVLCSTTQAAAAPTDWTATQVGPIAPDNNWRMRFRTLVTAARVAQGTCESAFSVDFTWACPALPGSQNYDAVSSSGSDAGVTAPTAPVPTEPTTWGRMKALYR